MLDMRCAEKDVEGTYKVAEQLLENEPNSENAGELHRMLGEMKYRSGDYKAAAEHLEQYMSWAKNQQKDLVRNDIYMLGMAEYRTGAYERAVLTLKQVRIDVSDLG